MTDLSTKILDVVNLPVNNGRGAFVPGLRVDFMIGSHGPYNVIMTQSDYTAPAAKAAVEKYAAELRSTLS